MNNIHKTSVKSVKNHIAPKAQVVTLGKAIELTWGSGNKRQEHNRTPQITNIERRGA